MHFFIDNWTKYPHTNNNGLVRNVGGLGMNKKIFCVLLCILLCITVLTGCGNDKTDDTVSTVGQNDTTQEIVQIEDGIYIMLYMLNENSWDTEIDANTEDADAELSTTVVAEISEKDLNAETIVAKYNEIVVQSLYGEMFDVNKVTKIDDKVIIDFDADSVKAIDIVEGEEGQLFYNLARSIEENLGDVHSVYLTMDGGNDFRLGHLWFVAEEPFYSGRGFAE